ncbi:MAG: SEC-C metal-binding domain-containing protein [Candidatus Aquicultor sp.]|nr:SEC-C metal-binding domain-containing protein [Candidatus Aquicultor sp.]
MPGVGRNEPCPCGSGKKFKKCCGARPFAEIKPEASTKKRQVDAILTYLSKQHREAIEDAYEVFFEEFDPEEHLDGGLQNMAMINFWDWVVSDALADYDDPDNRTTLLDLYIEDNREQLTGDDLSVLGKLRNSYLSLYEVAEVYPEEGLFFEDLLLGGSFSVRERTATRYLNKWDIIAVRLLEIDGEWAMSGSIYSYHRHRKAKLIQEFKSDYELLKGDYPDFTMRDSLKENGDLFMYHWYEPLLYPEPPQLATSSGEQVLISKARFDVNDKDAVIAALTAIDGFEREDESFVWLGETEHMNGLVLLGQVVFEGDRLVLETNSKERLEKGKALISEHAAGLVMHKADEFQDILQALENQKPGARAAKDDADDIPPEMRQQIYEQFMQGYYENWLNDRIPMLDGKTPLEAVRTEDGKHGVIETLKSIENSELRNKKQGQPHVDIAWLWERLGLERPEV